MSPRFNPLKKPLMTMRPAAMRKNHQGVDMVVVNVITNSGTKSFNKCRQADVASMA